MSHRSPRKARWIWDLIGAGLMACTVACGHSPVVTENTAGHSSVTFAHDVAPIIFEKCSCCHHAGQAAPFSLLSYDDVRRRASQIVDVTQKRFMPPWLPSEGHGDFAGARRLSAGQLQTLADWVEASMPPGDEADLPQPPQFVEGWQIGTPDLILESPAYTLAADGSDEFRNFVVPISLDEPRWVESIELQPDNPRATHHARVGVDSSYESIRRDAADPEPGYAGMTWGQDPDGQLIVWAPGMLAQPGTPGVAWRLHPKTCLVLHTHMQPTGKPETIRFRLGLHFAAAAPQQHPAILRLGCRDIDIPADVAQHTVRDSYSLPIDVDVHMVFPHAHSLCQKLQAVAELPDRSRIDLIAINQFDENWHETYRYRQPIRLPKGTRVLTEFNYDNTAANLRNRHRPPQRTVYGSNVEDEMADIYLQVTPVHPDQRAALLEDYTRYDMHSQVVGLKRALEVRPLDPWNLEGIAASYFGLGQAREAIEVLQQRLKVEPRTAYPLASLGLAHFAAGDFAQAEAHERQALAMDKEFPLAWLGLGKALLAQKKTELAERAFRKARDLAPGMVEARLNLADLLLARGELDAAAAECSATISVAPDTPNAYLKLAAVEAKRKHYDESLSHLQHALELAPYTHPAKVLLAVYCFQNGELEKSRQLLAQAHADAPTHPVPLLFLGQAARRGKDYSQARDFLAEATRQPLPGNWPASHAHRFLVLLHSERFQLAQQLDDEQLARDALQNWLKIEPENEKLRSALNVLQQAASSSE